MSIGIPIPVLIVLWAISLIVWNGVNGRGYKFVFSFPPADTPVGKLSRVGMFIVAILVLGLIFITQAQQNAAQGNSALETVAFLITFFGGLVVIVFALVRKNQ